MKSQFHAAKVWNSLSDDETNLDSTESQENSGFKTESSLYEGLYSVWFLGLKDDFIFYSIALI